MEKEAGRKSRLKRILKIILWIFGSILLLFLLIILLIRIPAVQNFLTQKAVTYLSEKTKTRVELKRILISFPKKIHLEGFYIEDRAGDTLLWVNDLKVDVSLFDLLKNKLTLNSVQLDGATGHVRRLYPDTTYNYTFITDAFASSDTTVKVADTGESMKISVGKISLGNLYLTYDDTIAGIDAMIRLGEMQLAMKDLDLEKMRFEVKSFSLEKTRISLRQSVPLDTTTTTDTASAPFSVFAGEIRLADIQAWYMNPGDSMDARLMLGSLILDDVRYQGDSAAVENLEIEETGLAYDKTGTPEAKRGIDFNHPEVSGFVMKARDIIASPEKIRLKLEKMALREKSGFELKNFRADIIYDSTHAALAGLDLETGHSRIRSHLEAGYPSLRALQDSLESVSVKMVLDHVTVSMKDVLYFMPELTDDPSFARYNAEKIDVHGRVDGTMARLTLRDFDLAAGSVTRIRMDGTASNVTDAERLTADLKLHEFTTSRRDVLALVPPDLIPKDITIPEYAEADGFFSGSMNDFRAELGLRSSAGGASASVVMRPVPGPAGSAYKAHVSLFGLNPGKIINQQDLGPITLELDVKGQGLDTATISADIDLKVSQAMLMNYNYRDFVLKGHLEKMAFEGDAAMTDSNLRFSYTGFTDLDPRHMVFDVLLYLKGADLKALNLSQSETRVSGTVATRLTMNDDGNFLGDASLARVMVIEGEEKYTIDSVVYHAEEREGITSLGVRAPGVSVAARGRIFMQELGASLMRHLSGYYAFSDAPDTAVLRPQQLEFTIALTDPELPQKLVPSLDKITPFELTGNYDSEAGTLSMKGEISSIVISGMNVDTLGMEIASGAEGLTYDISSAAIYNNLLKMENFALRGEIENNSIVFRLSSEKADSGVMIAVSGIIEKVPEGTRVVLDPPLTLANTDWNIAPRNSLLIGENGMVFSGLTLTRGDQSLGFVSRGDRNPPLEISFKNFEIGNFSKIIEKDTQLVRGIMNGNFTMISDSAAPGFTSDLTIAGLSFQNMPVGDLALSATSSGQNVYALKLGLTGSENDLMISGTYSAGEQDNLDLLLEIRNLAMKTVEPFTFGQLTGMSGGLSGNVRVNGSTSAPVMDGSIRFNQVKMRPGAIGTLLTIDGDEILLEGTQVRFDNFTMTDSLNNKAVVDGYTDISDMTAIAFDLTLATRNFTAMNTKQNENDVVFGKILLDSDIHLTGTTQKPVVDVKVRLNDGTDVTFVNQSREAGMIEYEGIVMFVDSISLQHPIMTREDSAEAEGAGITEIDLKARISFDENALLKMMVDPVAGDSLYVKGSGDMEFTLDPSGTMSLTGRYKIREGGYHLTISGLIKRDFTIREGSSVTWNGDLMEAEANITALYEVETSPLILLEDQLSGANDQQKNRYRNTLKFEVLLNMEGVIRKPEISFDIELNEKDRGAMGGVVYSKLAELRQDESQLNKQVFSLLTLGRFLGQDPLESGNAPITVSSAARSSASKLLTDQLNNLSDKYIKGVDLDVGVKSYEDYSTGQAQGRTELQLGISKEMLQGRLNVRVGSNIDIEGERATQNNLTDIAGDISAEYKLTEDGRFRLKGFRTQEYENPIEGELTKTGIGFIYTRDFNKIREIYEKENKQPLE